MEGINNQAPEQDTTNRDNGTAPGGTTTGAEQLNIKVKAQDGTEIFFKIKRTT